MSYQLKLELALTSDAEQISDLLNLAYRGEKGWTTENRLIEGKRSTIKDIKSSINKSTFLTYKNKGDLISCICLDTVANETYIGSFAVHPSHQSKGLGKAVLDLAEKYAITEFGTTKFIMVVLSKRTELISYYQRRGYKRTGIKQKYPSNLDIGNPKFSDITIEQLYKIA